VDLKTGEFQLLFPQFYWYNVISLPIEYHHVIKCFTWWVDEFIMPAAGDNLVNLMCFMTDFNRHSTGIQQGYNW
jgi:hypothetical protein